MGQNDNKLKEGQELDDTQVTINTNSDEILNVIVSNNKNLQESKRSRSRKASIKKLARKI